MSRTITSDQFKQHYPDLYNTIMSWIPNLYRFNINMYNEDEIDFDFIFDYDEDRDNPHFLGHGITSFVYGSPTHKVLCEVVDLIADNVDFNKLTPNE